MAQLILVDTDLLIDAGRKVTEAVDSLEHMEQQDALGVSVIMQMELMVGCRNKRELRVTAYGGKSGSRHCRLSRT